MKTKLMRKNNHLFNKIQETFNKITFFNLLEIKTCL